MLTDQPSDWNKSCCLQHFCDSDLRQTALKCEGFISPAKHAKIQEIAPFYALFCKTFPGEHAPGRRTPPPHTHHAPLRQVRLPQVTLIPHFTGSLYGPASEAIYNILITTQKPFLVIVNKRQGHLIFFLTVGAFWTEHLQ